jgi:hypothetical protein
LLLMLKPSRGPSRSGAQAIFGTRGGATIGMAGVATTTGVDMDPTPITGISVDPVVLAIVVDMATMVVLAITVDLAGQVVLGIMAVTADRCSHQLTELI